MIPALRAEFRKLYSIRSTYVVTGLCLLITILFAFYLDGYRADVTDLINPGLLAAQITTAAEFLGLFIAIGGVLPMTHEYRYGTIMYTLTASRSRTTVLLAKFIVVSLFAILLTLIVSAAAPFLAQLGIHAKGLSLVAQQIPYRTLLWHAVFYGWGYSMLALIIATIVRNQFGTLAVLLLFPGLGETLLGLFLKDNAKYLPFNSLSASLNGPVLRHRATDIASTTTLTQHNAMLSVLVYLIVGWIVTWLLFLRRDAN